MNGKQCEHLFETNETSVEFETRGHHEYEEYDIAIVSYEKVCKHCELVDTWWSVEVSLDDYLERGEQ